MDSTTISLATTEDVAIVDLTERITEWLAGRGEGLCHVFVPHATAGVALMEVGAGSERDAATMLQTLLPRDGRWVHAHGSPGHGADHLLPLLVAPSLSIPVLQGRLALGTWQSVVLVDTNRDNADRRVRLSFLAG
jgi:secondary thiamine-phosphate synthase enzyme